MGEKIYNTLSQEKMDKFIEFLISDKKISSKTDFAKLMGLCESGLNDKQKLNNYIYRDKSLKSEFAIKVCSTYKISLSYFFNDEFPISDNPIQEHKSEDIKIQELTDNINELNTKFDSFMKKTSSEKGEVLGAFKKDAKNLLNALNEAALRLIIVISKSKLLVEKNDTWNKFLDIHEINLHIKESKDFIYKLIDDLTENNNIDNLFKQLTKLRDEYFNVDNYRYTVIVLERMFDHCRKIDQNVSNIGNNSSLLAEMYLKIDKKTLNSDENEEVYKVMKKVEEFEKIVSLYILIYTKMNFEILEKKFYEYNIKFENKIYEETKNSFKLNRLDSDIDYQEVYKITYNLFLKSFGNENVIFDYMDELDQEIYKALNIVRKML